MPKMISVNIGFVTNSSSMVHHFPKSLLQDPQVKAFLEAFEVEDGFIGRDLWHRGMCGSLLLTKEQKEAARVELASSDYCRGPGISRDEDEAVLIYGDEHQDLAYMLGSILRGVAEKNGGYFSGDEYN